MQTCAASLKVGTTRRDSCSTSVRLPPFRHESWPIPRTKEELFRSDQNLALEESKINDLIQALYANSNSPYKGYAMAQDAIQISDPDDRASRIITGLLWAAEYGDSRASTDSLSKALTGDVLGGKRMEAQLLAAQQMLLILKKDRRFGCSPVQGTPISEKTW